MSSDSVKRIMAEVRELSALNKSPDAFFTAAPLEADLFEWHFTVRGPPETAFADGLYHGRILLPPEYPLKAPEIILLTPNGRFEVGTRICLSVTSHHNETWQPSWGVRTILTALVGFMPSKSEGLGALDYPADDRRALARKSLSFECRRCGARPADQFPNAVPPHATGAEPSHAAAGGAPCAPAPGTSGAAASTSVAAPVQPQAAVLTEPAAAAVAPVALPTPAAPAAPAAPQGAANNMRARAVRVRRRAQQQPSPQQERGLLYLALAISAAIVAIIARRFYSALV
jgi:ubiquitin-conjugating enzyme E2 J1